MACRGVLFAIPDTTARRLLDASSDEERMEIVDEIEEEWDEEYVAETDKAWDAMHRALSDGSLDIAAGTFPLNRAILGGQHLYEGDDYIIALVPKQEVAEVALALASIDEDAFRERYRRLVPRDYAPEYGEEDCEYTSSYFGEVATFYARAAKGGRAVIFTSDQ